MQMSGLRTGILSRKHPVQSKIIAHYRPVNSTIDTTGEILHGHNGGVWEWTDTPFEGLDGYVPSELYPGFSADFFDSKHYVVVSPSNYTTVQC